MSDCSIPFNVKGKVFRKLVVLEKVKLLNNSDD